MDNLEHGWQELQANILRARAEALGEAIATARAAAERSRLAEQMGDIELSRAAAAVLASANAEAQAIMAELGLEVSL